MSWAGSDKIIEEELVDRRSRWPGCTCDLMIVNYDSRSGDYERADWDPWNERRPLYGPCEVHTYDDGTFDEYGNRIEPRNTVFEHAVMLDSIFPKNRQRG